MKHIVSYSGGKDSTAMLLKMIDNKMQIDDIIYCEVMATSTLGGEYPEMYEYLEKVDNYLLKTINKKITRIKTYINFEEQFYTKKKRGKHIGEIYGFPFTCGSWCNDRLKVKALRKYEKSLGEEYMSYIGIASDEPKRLARLKKNQRAPLAEWGMTELDCLEYTKAKGLYNPLYDKFDRLGCWFCVKQNLRDLKILRKDYQHLWNMLLKWQMDSKTKFRPNYTVQELEAKFKKEDKAKN